MQSANFDIHEVIETDSTVNTLHNNSEQFGECGATVRGAVSGMLCAACMTSAPQRNMAAKRSSWPASVLCCRPQDRAQARFGALRNTRPPTLLSIT